MRSEETFQAWLEYSRESLRLSKAAHTTGDYSAVAARDAEGLRLWKACLADGWTWEDGNRALEEAE